MTDHSFNTVLQSLESSLQVNHIATQSLIKCDVNHTLEDILSRNEWGTLSQFPVQDGNRIVGVLERETESNLGISVREVMKPLDERMLVESSTGILSYIHLAALSSYHLVVTGNQISGIVTRSDLLKLPVRVVLFTLLTHLETSMGNTMRILCPEDSWMQHLKKNRIKEIEKRFLKGKEEDVYADHLLFTEWCDKRDILAEVLPEECRGSKSKFLKSYRMLEKIRNNVMHSNNYLTDAKYLSEIVECASYWIKTLEIEAPLH